DSCRLALLVIALLAAGRARAATYYVDSRNGDDAAAGTSPAAAWRGVGNLESKTFAPGDSILFARGSSYRGGFTFCSSGTRDRPIVLSSYGSERDPPAAFTNPRWEALDGNIFRVSGSWVVIDRFYFHDNTN